MKTAAFLVFVLTAAALAVPPPGLLHHQGRLVSDGVNFDGTGHFKFALVDPTGATTFWSNDGTSTAGGEPTAAVPIAVAQGHYALALGDTALTNMTAAIPADVFVDNSDVRLRLWFSADGVTFEQLTPDRRLTSAGYALSAREAQSVSSGAITTGDLAEGSVTVDKLAGSESFRVEDDGTIHVRRVVTEIPPNTMQVTMDVLTVTGGSTGAQDVMLIGGLGDESETAISGSTPQTNQPGDTIFPLVMLQRPLGANESWRDWAADQATGGDPKDVLLELQSPPPGGPPIEFLLDDAFIVSYELIPVFNAGVNLPEVLLHERLTIASNDIAEQP